MALIAGTTLEQSSQWIGGLGGLFGTRYGCIALLKLTLFILLLALAAINRFVLTGRLAGGGIGARRSLLWSVAAETVLGTLVILAAGFLASTMPATHEQPIWPFSWRPSLELLMDPAARQLFFGPLSLVGLALLLVGLGWSSRLMRWPAVVACTIVLAFTGSRLVQLLTVEAYPSSFVSSPTGFAVGSIARGATLFAANCSNCHGAGGRGDGPAAGALPIPPADLTAPHFLTHADGELFWFIAHGMDAPSGEHAMPGFSGVLSSEAIWALIDYLHAHYAGTRMREDGAWADPVEVPRFDALCADGTTLDLDDLRGHMLRFVTMAADARSSAHPVSMGVDIKTILLTRDRASKPTASACVTIEPEAWSAFAILLGVTPDEIAGTQILSDADLRLRARLRLGEAGDWNDPRRFSAVIREIAEKPVGHAAKAGMAIIIRGRRTKVGRQMRSQGRWGATVRTPIIWGLLAAVRG